MPSDTFTVAAGDGLDIVAYEWDATREPRAIAQLTHGMGEHALRYEHLANTLAAHGFVVVAQDHRGHGASMAAAPGDLGVGGWPGLIDDMARLGDHARSAHPDLPLVLVGHSMGSFAAQQFALDHSHELAALVLTGTAAIDLLEPALDLDAPIDLSGFNAPFAPARTDFDWLSRDEEQVDRYVADELCGFGLSSDAGKQMFVAARPLADADRIATMRADLPVYIAVGEHDPVNGQLALVEALVQRYRAHLHDVTLRVYPGARHEILNETNRDEVETDLVTWLDRVVPA